MITEKELKQAQEIYKNLFNDEINITLKDIEDVDCNGTIKGLSFDDGYFLCEKDNYYIGYDDDNVHYMEYGDEPKKIKKTRHQAFLRSLENLYHRMQMHDLRGVFLEAGKIEGYFDDDYEEEDE